MVVGPADSALKPLCSVCIANYNGERTVEAALHSVYAQDCEFPVEIIVHDDASTDESVDRIHRHHPQVNLLVSKGNVGYCVSNNRMAARARGEYILLLNNDAALFPDALRTLHQAARRAAAQCILGLPQYDAASGAFIDSGSLLDFFMNPVPNRDRHRREVAMVIGACLWIPKSLWIELGGFPRFFGSNAEDLFLCCHARLRGYTVGTAQESGFKHAVGASLGGGKVVAGRLLTTFRRRSLSERNKSYALALVFPSPWVWLVLPLHLVLLALEGLVLAVLKREHRIWREIYRLGIAGVICERRMLRRRRREIQQNRRANGKQFFSPFVLVPHKLRMLLRYGMPEIR
jgi:GT2 family glycosyltransferase